MVTLRFDFVGVRHGEGKKYRTENRDGKGELTLLSCLTVDLRDTIPIINGKDKNDAW